jgi:hypothetical protein
LRQAPEPDRRRRNQPATTQIWIDTKTLIQCRQIKGIWYQLEMANLPPEIGRASSFTKDAVLGLVSSSELSGYYQGRYYALEKKQLNSHEIQRWVHPVLHKR